MRKSPEKDHDDFQRVFDSFDNQPHHCSYVDVVTAASDSRTLSLAHTVNEPHHYDDNVSVHVGLSQSYNGSSSACTSGHSPFEESLLVRHPYTRTQNTTRKEFLPVGTIASSASAKEKHDTNDSAESLSRISPAGTQILPLHQNTSTTFSQSTIIEGQIGAHSKTCECRPTPFHHSMPSSKHQEDEESIESSQEHFENTMNDSNEQTADEKAKQYAHNRRKSRGKKSRKSTSNSGGNAQTGSDVTKMAEEEVDRDRVRRKSQKEVGGVIT